MGHRTAAEQGDLLRNCRKSNISSRPFPPRNREHRQEIDDSKAIWANVNPENVETNLKAGDLVKRKQ